MALAKILQMLLRSPGGKKAAAKLYKQSTKSIPTKSPELPGVKVGSKPQMVKGELVKRSSIGGPTETTARRGEILERVMKMRKDPGMARGLQKMESRKASAMNTPGTPFEGKPLIYEPSPTNLRARGLMAGAKSSRELDFMRFAADLEKKGVEVNENTLGMLRRLFFLNK